MLQNGYGDCKDKHTLLQSLLKAENIQSYPALISSYRDVDPDVPCRRSSITKLPRPNWVVKSRGSIPLRKLLPSA